VIYKASVKALRGHRPYMEDEYVLGMGGRFAGVFDGHGGSKISGFLRENIVQAYDKAIAEEMAPASTPDALAQGLATPDHCSTALNKSFQSLSKKVLSKPTWQYQGSTAVVAYIHHSPKSNVSTIVTANIGDSRAVLSRGRKALDLTQDHKPNDPREVKRVKKLGGKVQWHGYVDAKGNPIPGTGVYRINGNLAVARAIGDGSEVPFVSDEAEMGAVRLNPTTDEFIVLASDGLWDVMTSQEAVSFVHSILSSSVGGLKTSESRSLTASMKMSQWASEHGDDVDMIRAAQSTRRKRMAKLLADEAMRKGSQDNICVIVLGLKE
jgi:serine/threonine protein phosphatase PrpC